MRFRLLVMLAIVAAALCSGGCLKRTISVTTDPPGALVWINDIEVGRTPLETDFTFYGEYDVRVRREGYEPIITHASADTPIEELPGIDLVAEAIPVRFHDVVKWHWTLVPVAEANAANKEETERGLIDRTNELRKRASESAGAAPKADAKPGAGDAKADGAATIDAPAAPAK